MHRFVKTRFFVWTITLLLLLGSGTAVFAQTIVDPLPENNLIENPWFREGNQPSLVGWTDASGSNVIWSLSQKQSNPGPDQVLGTSARLAFGSGQGGGTGQGGVDAYLYQVVAADPALNHLLFKIHWVTQWIDRATVTIYGGNSADGPWTAVWVPLDINQATSTGGAWTQTELMDRTIAEGFAFYKIELYGRYPEGRQQGVKYTGVYFSVDDNAGEVVELAASAATETAPANAPEPTTRPRRQTAVPPTNTPVPTATDLPEENGDEGETPTAAAIAAIETPESEQTRPAVRPTQPARSTPAPAVVSTPSNNISPVYLVIIGVLLLLVIVLGIGWARAARR
ncbi:MAG: hypothetical protein CL608_20850 [Anaerolineaceae bacterium]|nr:hypothetical protein [Anaerolineaceae bacterium]